MQIVAFLISEFNRMQVKVQEVPDGDVADVASWGQWHECKSRLARAKHTF